MEWWNKPRRIQILVDNDSWILPYARELCNSIRSTGDECQLRRHANDVRVGDVLFLLGCTRLLSAATLALNRRSLVVHESDLPAGRGFAPVQWQILSGRDEIEVCLLRAAEQADAGEIYLRDTIRFTGTELSDEIRGKQGRATVDLCLRYLTSECEPLPVAQTGTATTFPRRTPDDSRLDTANSIAEQFDLLRICDNQRYPAWFEHRGKRYVLQIHEDGRESTSLPAKTNEAAQPGDDRCFVVAGCRSWNRESFERHSEKLTGTWHYLHGRDELTLKTIRELDPHSIFFLHWSWLVPDEILAATNCVCFHMTDLPYGRGGSPLQNLIARGHTKTMLTALQMTSKLDAGPIYLKRPLSLQGSAAEILTRASDVSFGMIHEIIVNQIKPRPQNGPVTVFQRRRPADSRIEKIESLRKLYDLIRMLDGEGYPPAFLDHEGIRFEFSSAQAEGSEIEAVVKIRLREIEQSSVSLEKSA